jgi:hypothetical protein
MLTGCSDGKIFTGGHFAETLPTVFAHQFTFFCLFFAIYIYVSGYFYSITHLY